ncbi:MAG TPA: UdgX family uracil-DNA binding protein, partial [Bryobacteraceae bacterium]|jgi:DNA polymerase
MSEEEKRSAADYVPKQRTLPIMSKAVQSCRGCDLFKFATQAVFGEGKAKARIMMVGEQPGDQEDLQGRPFVGPAGRILDKALDEAGIDRSTVYVTNAVKHFKFEERGKRRLHKKPRVGEVNACRPWLDAEIETVKPRIVVALGATALLSLGGRALHVLRDRGQFFPHPIAGALMVTIHPSALLRIPDHDQREIEYKRFVDELKQVKLRLESGSRPA